jgi:2-(1,2-epoxy-1,2-dihydrophenyl)acetyl-CoA isomerase
MGELENRLRHLKVEAQRAIAAERKPMTETNASAVPPVLQETAHGVRVLRLNRPEKRNPLSSELVHALVLAIEEAAKDDAVRVVGLTGEGPAFSSGADLWAGKPKAPGKQPGKVEKPKGARDLVIGIRVKCEKPVIAGVNGIAIGAGLSLAMCADMRIVSSKARFHPGFSRAGANPDTGLSWTLPQVLGHERAMRFLLEQEMLDADAALAIGMVGEGVPAEGFDDAFLAYCHKIAEVAPMALRQTKRLVTSVGLLPDLDSHLRDELRSARDALATEDGKEAVRAIREKRKPQFTGS